MEARDRILARRARFLAATLAACGPVAGASPPVTPALGTGAPASGASASSGSSASASSVASVDSDGDGIPDAEDRCPMQKGSAAPWKPEAHGCPCLSIVQTTKVQIHDRVFFAAGEAKLRAESEPVLSAIADALAGHPEIALVHVVGRRDPKESPKLALARAEAVRAWLVGHKVDAARLATRDGGTDEDPDPARRRRVEFDVP